MAIDVTKSGDVILTDSDLWMQRALKAEKQCEEIRERLDYWKNRALDAEILGFEAGGKLSDARKALDDAQKQLKQARDDLQAQHMELLDLKASAYDLLMSGNPERRPTP